MPQSALRREVSRMSRLMKVALGEAEADLAIVGGSIVNVYTGEISRGDTVLTAGDRIAYVGGDAARSVGETTTVVDACGMVLIPGLIDGHSHTNFLCSAAETARYAMKGGVTTIITEVIDFATILGYEGVLDFLASFHGQPVKFFLAAPPLFAHGPGDGESTITVERLRRLLRRRDVVSLGETYWLPVVQGNPHLLEFIAEARRSGKRLDGHGAGASGNKLQSYVSAGVSSCHEATTAEEALERLRLGMFVMIREGEVRRELEGVAGIARGKVDSRNVGLCTDNLGPREFISGGYMDSVVQKAIDLGFEPVRAVQMATLNTARYFCLDDRIGGIAPGKCADIVIIPDLHTVKPVHVVSNGRLVVRDGETVIAPRKHLFPRSSRNSIHLDRDLTATDFAVPVDGDRTIVKVSVIDQVTDILTREAVLELPIAGGRVQPDVSRDIIKVAAIERVRGTGKRAVGFMRGTGIRRGAVATSLVWDAYDIIVAGVSDADMARAVNRLRETGGGIVVCADGAVIAEIVMPIGGTLTLDPMEAIARDLERVQEAAVRIGFKLPDVRLTLCVLTTGAIPFVRMYHDGMVELRQNRILSLFPEA